MVLEVKVVRASAAAVRHIFAMLALSKQRRACTNNPYLLGYICDDYIVKRSQSPVTEFVQKPCLAYFEISIRNQDKAWSPHFVREGCREGLWRWAKKVNCANEVLFCYDVV